MNGWFAGRAHRGRHRVGRRDNHPGPAPLRRDHQFVLLASARIISVLGNGFARVALAFAVLALPGSSPGRLSLVLACQALPQLVFILVGGVIADRMSRVRLMALADWVGMAAYGGLAVMVLTGRAPLVAMCALAVVAGTATALFAPPWTVCCRSWCPGSACSRPTLCCGWAPTCLCSWAWRCRE
ncbi:MFS transporter [Streptomyces sp. M10(2022)]